MPAPIWRVEVFKLDPKLFNVEVDANYPLNFPGPEDLDELVRRVSQFTVSDKLRSRMYELRCWLEKKTCQDLYTRERDWGWYPTFEDAEHVVLNNVTDIFENYYYNIARVYPSKHGIAKCVFAKDERWYQAFYDEEGSNFPTSITKIECPLRFKGHFGVALEGA